jgi:hypothetical protein
VRQPLAENDHTQTSQGAKYRPEAQDGITEKMMAVPFSKKIENDRSDQEYEKQVFEYMRPFI